MNQSLFWEHIHLTMFKYEYLALATGVRHPIRGLSGQTIKIVLIYF